MGSLIDKFITFAAKFIDLGASIQGGMLPVFEQVLEIGIKVVDMINALGEENIQAIASIAATTLVFTKLAGVFGTLILTLSRFVSAFGSMVVAMKSAGGVIGGASAMFTFLSTSITQALFQSKAMTGMVTSLTVALQTLGIKTALVSSAMKAMSVAFVTGARKGGILFGVKNALIAATNTLRKSQIASIGITRAAAVMQAVLAGNMTLTTAATYGLSAAFGVLSAAMGFLPQIIGAIVVGGALLVGVLGNADGAAGGLSKTVNGLLDVLRGIGSFLLSIFVPTWNFFVDVAEGVAFIADLLGKVFGEVELDLKSVNEILDDSTEEFERLADAVDKVREALDKLQAAEKLKTLGSIVIARSSNDISRGEARTLIEGAETAIAGAVEDDRFSEQKVDEESVVDNARAASESALDILPGSDPEAPEFNQTNVSQNYGDVNADPKEKEAMKRLIKDAMMEANTYRRQNDGFSG